jgi:2'-5' RNA ligase
VVPAIGAALVRACEGTTAFRLALSGEVGMFGRRVVWAGLEPSAALSALAASVAAAVSPVVPLPDGDRPFSAHLTLARAGRRPVSRALLAGVRVPALSWEVRRVVLMSSGVRYEVEQAVDLPAANA